jgi:LemA protein
MGLTLLIVLVLVLAAVLVMYNSLIGKRNQVDQAASSVDVMLKKRFDLIPNLVAAVDRYMAHERGLLTELTELRTRAVQGDLSTSQRVELDNEIRSALGRLMVSVEAYPDLKASQNFIQLQGSLNEAEEQISAARRAYNAAVTSFNNAIQMAPSNILAGMMSLTPRPLFTATEVERQSVDVRGMFQGGQ